MLKTILLAGAMSLANFAADDALAAGAPAAPLVPPPAPAPGAAPAQEPPLAPPTPSVADTLAGDSQEAAAVVAPGAGEAPVSPEQVAALHAANHPNDDPNPKEDPSPMLAGLTTSPGVAPAQPDAVDDSEATVIGLNTDDSGATVHPIMSMLAASLHIDQRNAERNTQGFAKAPDEHPAFTDANLSFLKPALEENVNEKVTDAIGSRVDASGRAIVGTQAFTEPTVNGDGTPTYVGSAAGPQTVDWSAPPLKTAQ